MMTAGLLFPGLAAAQGEDAGAFEARYGKEMIPLIARYCNHCHEGEDAEAEVDLAKFKSVADLRRNAKVWQQVMHMLESGQMPPRQSKQPGENEKQALLSWVNTFLKTEAKAHAGDPGRVVLRRLSNAEYTYTLRDLTGVASLEPAKEFPVDGAAGEGFTNTGNALVMSPSLVTKYLDAGKAVAAHAVLLPDGIRFSPSNSPQDWTNETLAEIRSFYRQFTDPRGGDRVNLQGIIFQTNEGGGLPLDRYLAATIQWRQSKARDLQGPVPKSPAPQDLKQFALDRGLSPKYLGILLSALTDRTPSPLLDPIRARWASAKVADVPALVEMITPWQKSLFKFSRVGHIGKIGGPTRWLEPVSPISEGQTIRQSLASDGDASEIILTLLTTDAGDGNEGDFVIWQQPRLVAKGRPDILLRDVRAISAGIAARRARLVADTAKYLAVAGEAIADKADADVKQLARKHQLDETTLRAWLDHMGVGVAGAVKIEGHMTTRVDKGGNYDFIKGWRIAPNQLPEILANSSDQHVRVPGNVKPHSIVVHPSPQLRAAIGWQSPIGAMITIEATVADAHPECGNGVAWTIEHRRGTKRQQLHAGVAQGNKTFDIGPLDKISVLPGDVISLLIGPRDGNHSCDLTAVDLKLTSDEKTPRTWNLAKEISPDVTAGNPHADGHGNKTVWHFYTEADSKNPPGKTTIIPAGSLLAKWQSAASSEEKAKLAAQVQSLLTGPAPVRRDSADGLLRSQLLSLDGPIFSSLLRDATSSPPTPQVNQTHQADHGEQVNESWGLDPALFGKHPDGAAIDGNSLCVRAPSIIEIRLPVELALGYDLQTGVSLDPRTGGQGSVQVRVVTGKQPGIDDAAMKSPAVGGAILIGKTPEARRRIEASFNQFRGLFPAALCYEKIVPVDEVVTLTLHHREDDHLARLMLDEAQQAHLDKLWDQLHYISRDALTVIDALEQLLQYATQDSDPKPFLHLRKVFADRAQKFNRQLIDTQPKHLDAVIAFADRAYRRPLTAIEADELKALYQKLRGQEIPHEEAIRLTLARVLVSPAFLYRAEKPVAGKKQGPVSDDELATRLSYFLWSSLPDDELRHLAAVGRLRDPQVLLAQMKRMLQNEKARRLATEFACQWLHIYDFDELDEKSERHFPAFLKLRGDMYEESIRFFTDLFQNGGGVLDILDADHAILNESLAKHYNIPGITGPQWRRVEGVKKFGRGGILAQASTLSKQSGASRTSPILRGNWISEVLLGEKLPRPPKDVPQLPEDESAFDGLTMRQITEKHSSDARCAVCHQRIDAMGFSLEAFDAIGKRREKDIANRPIDVKVKAMDGAEFEDVEGLRRYLLTTRREAFVRQFFRKLLGYSLGRAVQLSDEPLLDEMRRTLEKNGYKIEKAMELIVLSRQFREIRGRESAYDE